MPLSLPLPLTSIPVLPLPLTTGEASLAFEGWAPAARCALEAADPHTAAAYERRTGRTAHTWSFEDVAGGLWQRESVPAWDLVLCSYALHLLEAEALGATLRAVARGARRPLVLTPNPNPNPNPIPIPNPIPSLSPHPHPNQAAHHAKAQLRWGHWCYRQGCA